MIRSVRRGWGNFGNVSTFYSIVHHGVPETKWLWFRRRGAIRLCGTGCLAMPNEPPRNDRDWDAEAAEALEAARSMAPGPDKIEALRKAGLLRKAADTRGLSSARRGRPPK